MSSSEQSVSADGEPPLMTDSERLRLIEECVTDYAIITLDRNGRFASWNAGAKRILGYDADEALGQASALIFTPEDQAQDAPAQEMEQARRAGRAEDERWHVRKDGSRLWGSGILTALRDAAGSPRGYVKILRDQTRLHEAQTQRDAQQALLIEHERHAAILRERSRMAQELHDTLAQGLTGITLQLSLAEQDLTPSPEEARARLLRARDIARDTLAEARQTMQALRPQALLTQDLCLALAGLVEQAEAGSAGVLRWEQEGQPFPLLPEVENNLYRVAQEALTNALRHAQATRITVSLRFAPGEAQLRVSDNGSGFDAQAPPHGGGMGLPTMRERAEKIGAKWSLVSLPEQGTTLEVTLLLA